LRKELVKGTCRWTAEDMDIKKKACPFDKRQAENGIAEVVKFDDEEAGFHGKRRENHRRLS
jgi:hypothetical protein